MTDAAPQPPQECFVIGRRVFEPPEDYRLPYGIITQPVAYLGQRGSGKTWTAGRVEEAFAAAGMPFVVLDPPGAHWGLRAPAMDADGMPLPEGKAFPIVVVGGERGDFELDYERGEAVARAIIETGISAVLDLSLLRYDEMEAFLSAFLREMFFRNRTPRHLFLEEAEDMVPQQTSRENKDTFFEAKRIGKSGRQRGLGLSIINQRVATINKSVLEQCHTLFIHRLSGPRDREAVESWVRTNANWDEVAPALDTLPTLEPGEMWVWSPFWLRSFARVRVGPRICHHGGATPEHGVTAPQPQMLAATGQADALREAIQKHGGGKTAMGRIERMLYGEGPGADFGTPPPEELGVLSGDREQEDAGQPDGACDPPPAVADTRPAPAQMGAYPSATPGRPIHPLAKLAPSQETGTCLFPGCGRPVSRPAARGLCNPHFAVAFNLVTTGKTTWQALEAAGKVAPSEERPPAQPGEPTLGPVSRAFLGG